MKVVERLPKMSMPIMSASWMASSITPMRRGFLGVAGADILFGRLIGDVIDVVSKEVGDMARLIH